MTSPRLRRTFSPAAIKAQSLQHILRTAQLLVVAEGLPVSQAVAEAIALHPAPPVGAYWCVLKASLEYPWIDDAVEALEAAAVLAGEDDWS